MKKFCFLFMLSNLALLPVFSGPVNFRVCGTVTDKNNGQPLAGVTVSVAHANRGTVTDNKGWYCILVPNNKGSLRFAYIGYKTEEVKIKSRHTIHIQMNATKNNLNEVMVVGYGARKRMALTGAVAYVQGTANGMVVSPGDHQINWNTEEYDPIEENRFRSPLLHPFSTFSIDVDAASYSNVRRFTQLLSPIRRKVIIPA